MNVGEMQKKLSEKAEREPKHQFENLYSLLCHPTWLRVAHLHVNTNHGRDTAGVDGETMQQFNGNLDDNLARLRAALTAKIFEPFPVRRVYLPKPGGRKRPIGIPALQDRIVQEALRMILEPIWEADFSNRSYGFRPNRSTYDAIAYLGNNLAGPSGKGYQWVIEGDLSSYFDTIPHKKLMKAVKRRVADRDIRNLMWKFLRAGVLEQGQHHATFTGTPQGGIISPLAANIYLDYLDKYMESHYLTLPAWVKQKRRRQGHSNFLYVRYCDDFVVLCNGTKAQAHAMKEELGGFLRTLGLTLSEEKTKITHITEGFTFLGYRIIRALGTKGHMVPKVLIPDSAIKRACHTIRRMLSPQTTKESTIAKILAINRFIRGWCQYYRSTSSPSGIFDALHHEVFWRMAHWLGRKYKARIPTIMRRFYRDMTFETTYKTRPIKLARASEYKARKLLTKVKHNPYTGSEILERETLFSYEHLWLGSEYRQGNLDLREDVIDRQDATCSLCGQGPFSYDEVMVDHIIPRKRFKDTKKADSMDNLQILCLPCHRAKTKTDLKVLLCREKRQMRM